MTTIRFSTFVLLCCSFLFFPQSAMADADRLAALVIRFSQYSELPSQPDRLQLCVLHDHTMLQPLNRLLPEFQQFQPEALLLQNRNDTGVCHIVWSSFPYWPSDDWLQRLNSQPLIWISDHPDLFRRGVLISIHYTPNTMRFRVNHTQAKRRQIHLHSRLLQLAHEII